MRIGDGACSFASATISTRCTTSGNGSTRWPRCATGSSSRKTRTYYLAEIVADSGLFGRQGDPELDRIVDEMKAIEAADGLSDDESYRARRSAGRLARVECSVDARADGVMAEWMRKKGGLPDIATAYIEDRGKFDDRAQEGRRRMFPEIEDVRNWLILIQKGCFTEGSSRISGIGLSSQRSG